MKTTISVGDFVRLKYRKGIYGVATRVEPDGGVWFDCHNGIKIAGTFSKDEHLVKLSEDEFWKMVDQYRDTAWRGYEMPSRNLKPKINEESDNYIELIIYDNDGPEGYFIRHRFNRSHEAIKFIIDNFSSKLDSFNYEIVNRNG